MATPTHIFFDLDNTLTPSKSLIEDSHIPLLKQLAERKDVIVVSGHGEKDIKKHLTQALEGSYYILGQNGNRAEMKDGRVLWNNSLSQEKKDAIYVFIKKARAYLHLVVCDENDIVKDRDSQIAFSLIGHHEDKKIKDAFDPKQEVRRKLLADLAYDVKKLESVGVEIRIGGTTNLDIFELGKNKGYNVRKFIEELGWQKDECLYIGDALFPGGNDETVMGVIATHAVKDHNDTFEFIKTILT